MGRSVPRQRQASGGLLGFLPYAVIVPRRALQDATGDAMGTEADDRMFTPGVWLCGVCGVGYLRFDSVPTTDGHSLHITRCSACNRYQREKEYSLTPERHAPQSASGHIDIEWLKNWEK
jgi:hypothetical protein